MPGEISPNAHREIATGINIGLGAGSCPVLSGTDGVPSQRKKERSAPAVCLVLGSPSCLSSRDTPGDGRALESNYSRRLRFFADRGH